MVHDGNKCKDLALTQQRGGIAHSQVETMWWQVMRRQAWMEVTRQFNLLAPKWCSSFTTTNKCKANPQAHYLCICDLWPEGKVSRKSYRKYGKADASLSMSSRSILGLSTSSSGQSLLEDKLKLQGAIVFWFFCQKYVLVLHKLQIQMTRSYVLKYSNIFIRHHFLNCLSSSVQCNLAHLFARLSETLIHANHIIKKKLFTKLWFHINMKALSIVERRGVLLHLVLCVVAFSLVCCCIVAFVLL
jgi:hypothetical protein